MDSTSRAAWGRGAAMRGGLRRYFHAPLRPLGPAKLPVAAPFEPEMSCQKNFPSSHRSLKPSNAGHHTSFLRQTRVTLPEKLPTGLAGITRESRPGCASRGGFGIMVWKNLALTSLEFLLSLVDHIDPALAAHDLAIAVTLLERPERISDLHQPSPVRGARAPIGFSCQ
jgi:hypothetical protein